LLEKLLCTLFQLTGALQVTGLRDQGGQSAQSPGTRGGCDRPVQRESTLDELSDDASPPSKDPEQAKASDEAQRRLTLRIVDEPDERRGDVSAVLLESRESLAAVGLGDAGA
jgi:hypothetical protein